MAADPAPGFLLRGPVATLVGARAGGDAGSRPALAGGRPGQALLVGGLLLLAGPLLLGGPLLLAGPL